MKRGASRGVLILLLALTACSQSKGTATSASSAPANPIDFPLYQPSTVVSSRLWKQTVEPSAAQAQRGVFAEGAGTYSGHEVVAQTDATMGALESWIASMQSSPPPGYAVAVSGSGLGNARAQLELLGLDAAVFEKTVQNKRLALVVLAIDPDTFTRKAAPVLPIISKYRQLPEILRRPLDEQARAQTGFTVTEALDPATPIGAAIQAIDDLRSTGQRGVVLVDAKKE
jgi:hypothetical protein